MRSYSRINTRISINTWIFAVIIFTNLFYCYLIDSERDIDFFLVNGISARTYALLFALIWGVVNWIKLLKHHGPKYEYGIWIIVLLIMILLSALQSYFLYDQSIFVGIIDQRIVFIWALLYFPIRKCIYYGVLKYEHILKILYIICIIQLTVFIAQYFLRNRILFTYVGEGIRNNRIRYYYSPVLLDMIFMFALDFFLKMRGKKKIFGAGLIGAILFEVMIVQQFRLSSMGLILSLGLFVILLRGKTQYKLAYIVLGAFILGVLFNTTLVQNVLNTILNSDYDSGMQIRFVGKALYFKTLVRHPVLGGGYPSDKCQAAYRAAGQTRHIYLVDNGVVAFAYLYGGLGIIWVVSLWVKLLRFGMELRKKASEMAFLLFPVFFVITCINELHWYWEYGPVIFVIFICLAERKMDMVRDSDLFSKYLTIPINYIVRFMDVWKAKSGIVIKMSFNGKNKKGNVPGS